MKLPLRPFLALLIVVLGFSVGMASLLNYFKFESTIRTLEGARFSLVADDVGNNIELSLGLGLAFGEIGTLQELIGRHRGSDTLVLSIEVFDGTGRVRYSTDPARAGKSVPENWLVVLRRSEWLLAEPDAFVAGRTVRNSFNVVVGGVAVRYDRSHTDATVAEMARDLLELGVAITFALVLLGSLTLSVLAGRTGRAFAHAESAFSVPGQGATDATLVAEVHAFLASADRAESELHAARTRFDPDVPRRTA